MNSRDSASSASSDGAGWASSTSPSTCISAAASRSSSRAGAGGRPTTSASGSSASRGSRPRSHHPNIVTVYDAGEADGRLYIAMQYVDGTDLATVLMRGGSARAGARARDPRAGRERARRRARGRARAPGRQAGEHPHAGDGHAYLTDFGLTKRATSATSLTATGQFVGTAQYMAPEQIMGEAVDGRADIYALGCILFHCLTGVPPFDRENSVAVIYAHLERASTGRERGAAGAACRAGRGDRARDGQGRRRPLPDRRGARRGDARGARARRPVPAPEPARPAPPPNQHRSRSVRPPPRGGGSGSRERRCSPSC